MERSRQAPFGRGADTVVDTSVRLCRQVEPLMIRVSDAWDEHVQRLSSGWPSAAPAWRRDCTSSCSTRRAGSSSPTRTPRRNPACSAPSSSSCPRGTTSGLAGSDQIRYEAFTCRTHTFSPVAPGSMLHEANGGCARHSATAAQASA